jgi:phosphonate transport system permease protein
MSAARDQIRALWRQRPRQRFVALSIAAFAALLAAGWIFGGFDPRELFEPRRAENFARFCTEIRPQPLRARDWDWGIALDWARAQLAARGNDAVRSTLAVSILAIALAGLGGLLAMLPAARTFARPSPFLPAAAPPPLARRALWRAVVTGTRLVLVFVRSLPEFVWAFLLVALLGPSAWPAVLAIAVHNVGILGRLGAEAIENLDNASPAALRGLGARRLQVAAFALWPAALPRLLLYFFYRWETCVREATVLGLLGVVSLGYWIADARTRGQYDVFVFLILLGAGIVLVGDLVSAIARGLVRRAA